MKKKLLFVTIILILLAGVLYYMSLPDYLVFNSMSFSNGANRDTELQVIVYQYWNTCLLYTSSMMIESKKFLHYLLVYSIFITPCSVRMSQSMTGKPVSYTHLDVYKRQVRGYHSRR